MEFPENNQDDAAHHLERMDTKPEEVGSGRGTAPNRNLVSPMQIIRQGCISYDNHGALNFSNNEPYFDDIVMGQTALDGHSAA